VEVSAAFAAITAVETTVKRTVTAAVNSAIATVVTTMGVPAAPDVERKRRQQHKRLSIQPHTPPDQFAAQPIRL
jgi:hypothetical protein